MTTTLFNATLDLANHLGILRHGTATGGSTTTVEDTVERDEVDDTFNKGAVWIITDAGDASAAPEGEFSRVTDFDNATSIITVRTMTAVGAGDYYAVSNGRYPLDTLISSINRELVKHKSLRYDSDSLDVIQSQSEYELPAGITKADLINVYIETIKDDANDHQWTPIKFDVHEAATGSVHTLILESTGLGVGYDLLLEYYIWHPNLWLADDLIDENIPMAKILDGAAAHAELLRMRTAQSGNELDIDMLKWHREEAEKAEQRNPIRYKQSKGQVMESGGLPAGSAGVTLTTE